MFSACFGIPEVLGTNNGSCYNGQNFKVFTESWSIAHQMCRHGYPEAKVVTGRAVITIKYLMEKERSLANALLAYRATSLPYEFTPTL